VLWMHLARHRVRCEHGNVTSGYIKGKELLVYSYLEKHKCFVELWPTFNIKQGKLKC